MNNLLRQIRWRHHVLGLVFLLLAIIAFSAACLFLVNQQQALEQSQARYRSQQLTNRNAEFAQQQLDTYLLGYRAWQQQGFIGDTQRLQWLEALKTLTTDLQLPQLLFTLESSRPADYEATAYWHDELSMQLTPMRLEMRLAHEGDFARLMQRLRNQANGLFSVNRCEIRREIRQTTTTGLHGYCDLLWYSMRDITAQWYTNEGLQHE